MCVMPACVPRPRPETLRLRVHTTLQVFKSWAEEERTLFMDKFLQHPKVGLGGHPSRVCRRSPPSPSSAVSTAPVVATDTPARDRPSRIPCFRLAAPQDFRKISTYLPGRSPGDCVAFFYKNQKLDDFSTVRRKQQLKKRRLQVGRAGSRDTSAWKVPLRLRARKVATLRYQAQ